MSLPGLIWIDRNQRRIALRLLQRTMQQLKSEQIKLEYDWVVVWRSILTLSSFVVTHVRDLRTMSDQVDNLISQVCSETLPPFSSSLSR